MNRLQNDDETQIKRKYERFISLMNGNSAGFKDDDSNKWIEQILIEKPTTILKLIDIIQPKELSELFSELILEVINVHPNLHQQINESLCKKAAKSTFIHEKLLNYMQKAKIIDDNLKNMLVANITSLEHKEHKHIQLITNLFSDKSAFDKSFITNMIHMQIFRQDADLANILAEYIARFYFTEEDFNINEILSYLDIDKRFMIISRLFSWINGGRIASYDQNWGEIDEFCMEFKLLKRSLKLPSDSKAIDLVTVCNKPKRVIMSENSFNILKKMLKDSDPSKLENILKEKNYNLSEKNIANFQFLQNKIPDLISLLKESEDAFNLLCSMQPMQMDGEPFSIEWKWRSLYNANFLVRCINQSDPSVFTKINQNWDKNLATFAAQDGSLYAICAFELLISKYITPAKKIVEDLIDDFLWLIIKNYNDERLLVHIYNILSIVRPSNVCQSSLFKRFKETVLKDTRMHVIESFLNLVKLGVIDDSILCHVQSNSNISEKTLHSELISFYKSSV